MNRKFVFGGNVKDFDRDLYDSARKSDWKGVYLAIENGATKWEYGLEGAAEAGDMEMIEYFIGKGAKGWDVAFLASVFSKDRQVIDFFISKEIERGEINLDEAIRQARLLRENEAKINGDVAGYDRIIQYLKTKRSLPIYTRDPELDMDESD